ncbi:primase-helicase family protein [Bacteroides sp. UBA939]|uniref:primase-helicase family protein n=1 Tax=Bacteroides sp. UBA939 TaxID=1946092 RepID=UPI0025C23997|nr:CHC2 zinc finger domain-containing protein [Bacteroides sp. UBA939]
MYFTQNDVTRITDASKGRLLDVAQDFHEFRKSGTSYVCDCPRCGAARKFSINPAKDVFGCFSCHEVNGGGALSYLMKVEGKEYLAALEYLANKFNVLLDEKPGTQKPKAKKLKKGSKAAKGVDVDSYCARMLAASGLTVEDVTAKVYKSDDKSAIFESRTFRPGTIDERGAIIQGDDVIIEYYDLDGMPVTYYRKDNKKRVIDEKKEYFRVRWQFPDSHLDKEGKPFKYKSPPGSGTPVYIPERLRRMYKEKTPIPRLYIQEGEKKAEKACKHGIPSIAVSGIQNLGMNKSLPEDVVRIITNCAVKEVAFIFDSDWDDISANIKINDQVEKRPRNFYYAAKNFKEYMRELKNRNIYVEVFIGHIQKNSAGDKGLDDILANTLAGNEDELAADIEFACNDKKGLGKYVEMFKITTLTDHKIAELWCLHSHEAFAERHKDVLINLPEFVFGRYRWKFDDSGKVVLAQPFDDDEKFWNEETKFDRSGNARTEIDFCYVNSQNFLQNRGFGRLRRLDKSYQFIHLDPPVVRPIEASDARDYLFQFAKHYCKKEVNEMLIKGVSQYVGPDKLSLLGFIEPNFIRPNRESQYLYFDKNCWHITRDTVKEMGYESISHHIWEEQKKGVPAKYLGKPLIRFQMKDGQCSYDITREGKSCHFLRFLENASNFTWRKQPEEIEEAEENENRIHLLSKLCAIGYMAMEAKDNNVARAVIGMDGKQSEVGESNGRSGKSLIGELMRNVTPTAYISGKRNDIFADQFIWNDVQENTKLVFIDDVLRSFNFEFLFPVITGDWTINYKGGRRITIPFAKSAKIYIPTNHAIRGTGSSYTDRQWLIAFSDYYNDVHKPLDDFGCLFFSEWDYEQWNLTWNMLANCIQLYLTFGVVQAPGERLEMRKLRQEITEPLISWADEYFSDPAHLNTKLVRPELYDAFKNYDRRQEKYISTTDFKKKIKLYCKWKGYVFNPNKYDPVTGKPHHFDKDGAPILDDKSGGVEYFTIGCKTIPEITEDASSDSEPQLPFTAASNKLIDY